MAAALDFADAGFHTELFESRPDLGGGLIASATPPHKDKLFWYLDYLRARLASSSVIVHTGVPLEAADFLVRRPDVVVLATGASALDFPLQGADGPNALSAYALLMGEAHLTPPGELPVVVYGGGETGCESAEFLAARGYRVILVTRSPAGNLARSAEGMYRKHLRARLLANPAVTIRENSTITAISDGAIHLTDPSGEHTLAAAGCVLAQGRQTGTSLAATLTSAGIPFALVGDVEKIGRIGDAVHAARRAVLDLTSRSSKFS
jgi:NADPH-dependent 2,4-dienoyl-CoA reductase/sulfur reductase-like enzyme